MNNRKPYTAPPDPVYNLGKRKQNATEAYKALARVIGETGDPNILTYGASMLGYLKQYRDRLDQA